MASPINCDPGHLKPDELSVEFEVRGIVGRGSAEFSKLRELMEAETFDPAARPTGPHAFQSEKAELQLLQRLVVELSLQGLVSVPDWDKALILNSRVWTIRYAGGPTDLAIDGFVFRVEEMAASSGIALADMVGTFHVLVTDRAAEYYWGFRRK